MNTMRQAHRRRTKSAPRALTLTFDDLEARTMLSTVGSVPTDPIAQPAGQFGPYNTPAPTGLSPSQIIAAYGFNKIPSFSKSYNTTAGAGETIAIVDAFNDPNIASDLAAFSSTYGLPALDGKGSDPTFSVSYVGGGTNDRIVSTPPANNVGWGTEISLDVEWAHVIAPQANIKLFEAAGQDLNSLVNAIDQARNSPNVTVVSMSFGLPEFSTEASYDTSLFVTPANHPGVTFVAASGDSGGIGASWPASSPHVLSVGGTTLSITPAPYGGESGWNGSGGGPSQFEPRPSYQTGFQSSGARETPDVSYDGDPNSGVSVYDSFGQPAGKPWLQVGGTSASAPQWAALVVLADQIRGPAGALDGATQTIPDLYKLATPNSTSYASDFHDITTGNNMTRVRSGLTFKTVGYTAGPGYDEVTGLGSPVSQNLVPALAALTATTSARPAVSTLNLTGSGQATPLNLAVTGDASTAPGAVSNGLAGQGLLVVVVIPGAGTDSSTIGSDGGLGPHRRV
jgi:subtilase family serine protease